MTHPGPLQLRPRRNFNPHEREARDMMHEDHRAVKGVYFNPHEREARDTGGAAAMKVFEEF